LTRQARSSAWLVPGPLAQPELDLFGIPGDDIDDEHFRALGQMA
jgi:hypothetical protein